MKETLKAPYSQYLLDSELSREVDRKTISKMGIEGFTLMEIAGLSAAKHLLQAHENLSHGVYLCGKGNNCGDALVVARYLMQHDSKATLVFLDGIENLSPDAEKNLELLQNFSTGKQVTIFERWNDFQEGAEFDFIIDGMLGTGLTSEVRGDYQNAVAWANEQSAPTFSMDIPTGLHSDSGKIMGSAVEADKTFAFGGMKQGFYLNEGPRLTGLVYYCELPFPNTYKEKCSTFLLDENWVPMERPNPGKHKYDSGVLYIVAGSEGLTGAAIMAAESAWAEGPGAVILVCPRGVLSVYEHNLPSIIKRSVGSRDDFCFKEEHTEKVLDIVNEKKGKVLLGPGLGRDASTTAFVEQFLSHNNWDTVIDADGLWCLSQLSEFKKPREVEWILTPHPGELQKLLKKDVSDDSDRLQKAREFSTKHKLTLLSKGMPGIVGTPSGKCYLTNYNTRYFARAGSGDVLAGKIGAYLAMEFASDQSCAMALLRGKQKLDYYLQHYDGIPEPLDFV